MKQDEVVERELTPAEKVYARAESSLCPLCGDPIGTDFRVVLYYGKKVWVHKNHPIALLAGEKY